MAHKSSKKFSYIGENIKKIRQAKKISQADFAALFDLSRPSVGAYEEGRSEPKIETIIQIANYFRITIDLLLTRELTVSEIYSFGLLNQKLNKAHNLGNSKSRIASQSIPYVETGNYVHYIVDRESSDFIRGLPEISVPIPQGKEPLRAFEMDGSEMEYHQQGIHHGDILIGSELSMDGLASKAGKVVTVVHRTNITTRRLEEVTSKELILISDDPHYPQMKIPLKSILEVWLIRSAYSSYLKSPTLIEERLLRLENEMESLRKKLKLS